MKEEPRPDLGGPSSMFHEDGASTEVTGIFVSSRALMTAGNGSRTSPEKLKPGRHQWGCNRYTNSPRTEDGINNMIRGTHS